MVTTKIYKWGNSAAIRLPASLMKALQLEIGSHITLEIIEGGILLRPVKPYVSNNITTSENFTPMK